MRFKTKPRIIYNDDTISLRNIPQPHTVQKLRYAVDYLKGTQVDVFCWSMTACDIAYSWPSKVIESLYETEKGTIHHGFSKNLDLTLGLYWQGIDYLPQLIKATHDNGILFFASFRMNDCHHKGDPGGGGASKFWKNHQYYRLWDITDGLTWYNAALDYSYSEVRDRKFKAIIEVCEKYDIDGVEIDFNRDPYTFPADQAWSKRHILTHYFEKIRNALNRIGKKKGVKIGLLIRVPFSHDMRMKAGMDVEVWIKKGLMDVLVMCCRNKDFPGGNDYNQKVEPWLTICRKNDILFYPCVEVCPAFNQEADIHLPTTLNTYDWTEAHIKSTRAAAQNFLAQRVDGIYMFNYPCVLFEGQNKFLHNPLIFKKLTAVLSQVGSKNSLKGTDKLYYFLTDLPVLVESHRPAQYHQTIKFCILDGDLEKKKTRVSIRFRQEVKNNPHSFSKHDYKFNVFPKGLKYYLNDWEIPHKYLTKIKQLSGGITGFKLNAHEHVKITLPANKFLKGINQLAFHIAHFPRAEDPHIYIYDLGIEVNP